MRSTYLLLLCLCFAPLLTYTQIFVGSVAGTYTHTAYKGGGFAGYSYTVMEIGDSGQVVPKTMQACYAIPPESETRQTLTLLPDGRVEYTEQPYPNMFFEMSEKGEEGYYNWREDTLTVVLDRSFERFPYFVLFTDSVPREQTIETHVIRTPMPEPIEMLFLVNVNKSGDNWYLERVDSGGYAEFEKE